MKYFTIDGERHYINNADRCCDSFSDTCECGGTLHSQPIYGGIVQQCDRCQVEEEYIYEDGEDE